MKNERVMTKIQRIVKAFLKNAYDFSSVQFDLPKTVAEEIYKWGSENIPDDILTADGRESNIHITIKYGIHISDFTEVRNFFINEKSIEITLGKITLFEADDYDVVKIDVSSPDLYRFNRVISENFEVTDTHSEYHPHVTLCYVKKHTGLPYKGREDFMGRKIILDSIVFSGKDNRKTSFKLLK